MKGPPQAKTQRKVAGPIRTEAKTFPQEETFSEISGLTTHDPPIFHLKSDPNQPQKPTPNAQLLSFLFKFMQGCLQINPDLNKVKPR